MHMRRVLPIVGLLLVSAGSVEAQGLSFWLGGARPTGDTTAIALRNSEVYAGLQLDLPMLPIAIRAEGMTSASGFRKAPRTFIANAVVPLRLPGIQPYAIAGYGAYSYGKPSEVRGYNYGAGVRFGLGRTGIFGEVRRHEKLHKNVATVGITL